LVAVAVEAATEEAEAEQEALEFFLVNLFQEHL
jgi:hypothetical protein